MGNGGVGQPVTKMEGKMKKSRSATSFLKCLTYYKFAFLDHARRILHICGRAQCQELAN